MKIDSTRTFIAGAIGLPASAAILVPAAAFAADDAYIEQAVESLQKGQAYGPGVAVFNDTEVGVVVLPADAFETFQPTQIASQIYGQVEGDYETVIVVNTTPGTTQPYGVAPSAMQEQVWEILGGNAEGPDGVVGELVSDSGELIALTSTSESPEASGGGFDAAPVVVGGGGLLLGVAAVVAITKYASNRNKNRVRAVTSKAIRNREFRADMERFAELTRRHANAGFATAPYMRSILGHLNDLFTRLEKKGVGTAKEMAEVNYKGLLEKLNPTLDEDYYIDIAKNPHAWDNPSRRTAEVEKALAAVDRQVLDNIKQVNASKDLDFQIALETILNSADKPNASDMIR